MSYELVGNLHLVDEIQSKTETFQTREFVVKTEGTYPQFIKFQLTQDRCGLIDSFNPGNVIKVYFDLRGREWNGKYFTNLQAWKIELNEQEPDSGAKIDYEENLSGGAEELLQDNDVDDLPF